MIFILNCYDLEGLLNVYKTDDPELFTRNALNLLPETFCDMAADEDYNLMQNATSIQNFCGNATYQNLLAHIEKLPGTQVQALVLDGLHLYGSSRLGILKTNFNLIELNKENNIIFEAEVDTEYTYMDLGSKRFELSNHLGNVLATVLDRKTGVYDPTEDMLMYYEADVVTATMYYPFGSALQIYSNAEFSYAYGYNTQEKVDEIAGAGNHYTAPFWEYDPRVVMRWNTDPVTRAYKSPYVINSNNPITNNDPDGDCDDCETQVSGQVSATYTFGTKGQSNFNLSTGIGGSVRSGNVQGGLNLSLNLYNGGLGTTQGSTGQSGFQSDFVVSPSLTFGSGQASPMATNTFNSMSLSGVTNSFKSSGTLASNFIFNSDGRNQRVGSVGGRFGDFSFNVYNDFFPGIGDRGDEYWTGGGAGNINVGSGNIFSFGTEVFTGLRIGNKKDGFKLDPTNPANGRYGTYQQTDAQKNMNNGQTFFRLTTSDGLRLGVNFSGGANSGYSQAGIHNYLPGIKSSVFDYSHSIPSIQAIGGVLQGD